jgi:hypothetical protein
MKPYEQLANAIILQAVEQYKSCLQALKQDENNKQLRKFKIKTEQFFFSEYFNNITNLDPHYLIKKIKERL